ncbi:MAG: cyclic beta 1-2 glucan synthetase [Elusimicrobia bacterium GWB2_63_16]|nr:MAG: cyclic beta 1-2 glucan synthetase [Elusimicrobia bacterium GWB2_63_16]
MPMFLRLMKRTLPAIKKNLGRLLPNPKIAEEQPLRAELFNVDQFKLHAAALAFRHSVSFKRGRDRLLARLKENEAILLRAYELLNRAGGAKRRISPAGDWLLDNYYLIEEQIRLAQKFLPKGYSEELPSLNRGPLAGYPRVYDIAMEMVAHGDGRLDVKGLAAFVGAYQVGRRLKLGELWAVPIMIRLALIENLRRIASRMIVSQNDRDAAEYRAGRILAVLAKDTSGVILEIAAMAKAGLPLSDAFVAEFVRRLHGQSPAFNLPIVWLEKKLAEQGKTTERLIQSANQKQAADQVSIANTIESLRFLETTDWHDFVEGLSAVERELRRDPSGHYPGMAFATRDAYRHAVEDLALRGRLPEEEVAARAVAMAAGAAPGGASAHVGYYLADRGFAVFCRSLGLRLRFRDHLRARRTGLALAAYGGAALSLTLLAEAGVMALAWGQGLVEPLWLAAFGLPLLFPASQAALALANWFFTRSVTPEKLPRMDFSEGIPAGARSLTVIPTMLTGAEAIDSLLEGLEVCYLGNIDPNVDFALLTDFRDAAAETLPGDGALVQRAAAGIERLNRKYAGHREGIFYLLHRPRRWNPRERVWMGYERKRGKLADLNAALRGRGEDRFSAVVGDLARLRDVKFVITLDTDTRMPRDAARDLAGIMAHPLNRPVYDAAKGRVVSGYGILQPRVDLGYPGDTPSLFVRIFGGEPGIDPYTKTVSDVYQDLFFEGSFIGKGLYDVDAFEAALAGRLPENLILSHDLLEGCYARSALVTDVQLYEKYPSGYLADMNRRHRWTRGDWQISGWVLPFVPGPGAAGNPLSALSRWKILDNLRRSLTPAASAWLLLAGWFASPGPGFWPAALLFLAGFPLLLISCVEAVGKSRDISLEGHLNALLDSLAVRAAQFGLSLAFLAHEALYGLHAVAITYWRLFASRRRLLEWRTSGEAELQAATTVPQYARAMAAGPLAALAVAAWLAPAGRADALTGGFLLLWLLSPALAWLVSRAPAPRRSELSAARAAWLGALARRTWAFFETFVTGRDNWLPPDNYQEEFIGAAAHRTSPTNIGLSLLANLSAYDFGYLSMGLMCNRTEKTLRTMGGMEKYRGHFYNWYDTETLKPLKPLYVSSVDSGNMAGHLLVLRAGLLELKSARVVSPRITEGLADTLAVLAESAGELERSGAPGAAAAGRTAAEQAARLLARLRPVPASLQETRALLLWLSAESAKILPGLEGGHLDPARRWARAFERQCYDYLEDMAFIAPWTLLPPEAPGMWDKGGEARRAVLAALRGELRRLDAVPTLAEAARLELKLGPLIDAALAAAGRAEETDYDAGRERDWLARLRAALKEAGDRASGRMLAIEAMALACTELSAVEFEFLYNRGAHLLSIGYNVSEHRLDTGCYDLLASESRLCSYVAIAQGKLPQKHWFMLGRLLSRYGGDPVLVSWGGSVFEYLMPLLVMPAYEGTLLERTYRAMVACQAEYGEDNGIPWGMSESGYNKLDAALAYQYRSFGVPDLGFKRGLAEDLVVAPYASVLALMVEPALACANLERLQADGYRGEYGFYEAVDYTPSRAAHDGSPAAVRSYMAHHQGMSLLALAYGLLDRPMQRRFLADPMFKATELLLQERVPKAPAFLYDTEVSGLLRKTEESDALSRVFTTPHTPAPEVHLLSNGAYSLMVTNAGDGYTRWKDLAVTRWRGDAVVQDGGTYIYLRDADTGEFWSAAYQPTLKPPSRYEAIFSRSRAEFRRRDHEIEAHTEIAVSPEDNIDLRRVRLRNLSRRARTIELTSYAEVVLNQGAADQAHRAFSNLFVETEIIRSHQAILCSRRPRSAKETFPVLAHFMAVHGRAADGASYETDRDRFIGRGNTLAGPAAMRGGRLGDSEGAVLDPVAAIRCAVRLEPGESAVVDYVTGVCPDRAAARAVIEKYRDRNLADRVFDLAWTHAQVTLQQINATESDAQVYGRLASAIIYANPDWRAHSSVLRQNLRGQTDLWGYGISGDLPIVLVRVEDQENIGLVARMVQAHAYWRLKGLAVDLVVWNESSSVYRDALSERIGDLISADEKLPADRRGRIYSRRADQMSEEDKVLMQAVARIVVSDRGGTLAEHLDRVAKTAAPRQLAAAHPRPERAQAAPGPALRPDLARFNGLGGFTPDGREYVISTGPGKVTPAPWVNVLANARFGTVVSESGGAYTWLENAQLFRLTPWHNDAVTDASGEALYLRDEDSGRFWSPAPLPARGAGGYVSRHGFGYTIFEHEEDGLVSELTVFVALEQPVKFASLKLRNASGRRRSLSATSYSELVLGPQRDKSHMHVLTEVDPKSGALTAYNHYNKEFPGRVVFLDVSETARFVTGDRREFIGRNGSLAAPAAMRDEALSGRVGAGLDPCAAMQVKFDLEDGDEKEIVFSFGAAGGADEARAVLQRFSGVEAVRAELEAVWEHWKRALGVVYVETPDDSVNFLVNGWLQYQVLGCRLLGRSGFYQSGGAYGFRDQLQDGLALTHSHPGLVRAQLLAFAARQFPEGDAQHWWHPPSGRGVRSHCSDDYLWLPLAVCRYVEEIGDTGVLDEPVPFLDGPPVKPEEESYYDLPRAAAAGATLYEHCVRAVKHGLRYGERGLPLMGSGDWNDGMNLVGREGRGESVWLGFFLYRVLQAMAALAAGRGDKEFADLCLAEAARLAGSIEANAWDGGWYRRAYYDSGEPLGSASSPECRIDSLPQSWAVISGAAPAARAAAAMEQVDRRLVDRTAALVKLFEPPFDKCAADPGYIKGYLPGVRENGGQYTHAAVWAVIAFALLGDRERAWELLGLINPVRHSDSPAGCAVYKVEPYVMAGDVYSVGANAGRGGWTWYSGSAAWMYQLLVTHLLGLSLRVDRLCFRPCVPPDWNSYKLHYRYRETFYHITVTRTGPGGAVLAVTADGEERADKCVPLVDDRAQHSAEVRIG